MLESEEMGTEIRVGHNVLGVKLGSPNVKAKHATNNSAEEGNHGINYISRIFGIAGSACRLHPGLWDKCNMLWDGSG
jgi:hypothetical protein